MAAAASNELPSVKTVASSPHLTSLPSSYTFTRIPDEPIISESEISIPVIDYSLLTSGIPNQRSKIINDLRNACHEWGFFTVINHGVPEDQIKAMIDACIDFFNLTEEEKREYEGKHVLDPIRCGTSFNPSVDRVLFWRDFLKVFIHPEFHSPIKPAGFRELLLEYCKRIRIVARELLEGISESLGLEACHINQSMNFESGFQVFVANLYPPCPQPELAMGIPPHSDHGLLTLLTQNGINGLQIQHNGKWVNVSAIPNSFVVNIGDHIEIFSNGRYKSVLHRAMVNNKSTRLSLGIAHGPSLDTTVGPEPQLIKGESDSPLYIGMKYKDYIEFQQTNVLDGKTCLDRVRV